MIRLVAGLLSHADSVFSYFLTEIPSMLFDWDTAELLFRLFLIGLFALVFFGYLYTLFGPREATVALPVKEGEKNKIVWDGIILVTLLTIINVVYAAFVFIQISYLFSGQETVLPAEMTYAEYVSLARATKAPPKRVGTHQFYSTHSIFSLFQQKCKQNLRRSSTCLRNSRNALDSRICLCHTTCQWFGTSLTR